MLKNIFSLYIICFGCYVLFTREPDFFESEKITVSIIDSNSHYKANYIIENKTYTVNANYLFKQFKNGEKITVLYNPQKPQLANIYSVWGYWLRWEELLVSTFLIIGLYYLATSITQNPNPESLLQQKEEEDKPQRKYT
ncbi:MAG: DUF3592 domain-containing protein [Chitinophagaceae bacterium]